MKIIVTFKQHDFESLFLQASIVNQKSGDLNAHAVWLNCLNHSITEEFYVLHNIFLKFACKRVFITKPPMAYTNREAGAKFTQNFYP